MKKKPLKNSMERGSIVRQITMNLDLVTIKDKR